MLTRRRPLYSVYVKMYTHGTIASISKMCRLGRKTLRGVRGTTSVDASLRAQRSLPNAPTSLQRDFHAARGAANVWDVLHQLRLRLSDPKQQEIKNRPREAHGGRPLPVSSSLFRSRCTDDRNLGGFVAGMDLLNWREHVQHVAQSLCLPANHVEVDTASRSRSHGCLFGPHRRAPSSFWLSGECGAAAPRFRRNHLWPGDIGCEVGGDALLSTSIGDGCCSLSPRVHSEPVLQC